MSNYPECTEKCAAMPHCSHCGRTKKPVGRDAAPGTNYCDNWDCYGYNDEPLAGHLWPEEWREELEARKAEAK